MQRHADRPRHLALGLATDELHQHIFANYRTWSAHLDLPAHPAHASFELVEPETLRAAPHVRRWLTDVRLHELMLYLLVYGEAANLRFLPECLCFIHFAAVHRLFFPRDAYPTAERPSGAEPNGAPAHRVRLCEFAGEAAPTDAFLATVVTPLYRILKRDLLDRRAEPVSTRVLYDDVNEAFWDPQLVASVLPFLRSRPAGASRMCDIESRMARPSRLRHVAGTCGPRRF